MALEVILIRHAPAVERDRLRWPDDRLRPLSSRGKRRFRMASVGLRWCAPAVERVLCSPLARAEATARLLEKAAGWPSPVVCQELAPGIPVSRLFARLAQETERSIAVVGHEPGLGALLSAALGRPQVPPGVPFKKGGAACIRFAHRIAPGRATLLWFAPPRVLRRLGR
jgi:phosphohistidine phosphatase